MPKKKTDKPLENDPIIRSWGSCPFIYEGDSKLKRPNPDYHQEVCLTRSGKFVDVMGRPLDPKKVPAYIREDAKKKLPDAKKPKRVEEDMETAMLKSGVQRPKRAISTLESVA
jgi:hypothetical protein